MLRVKELLPAEQARASNSSLTRNIATNSNCSISLELPA